MYFIGSESYVTTLFPMSVTPFLIILPMLFTHRIKNSFCQFYIIYGNLGLIKILAFLVRRLAYCREN
jgi:hypothetical protein